MELLQVQNNDTCEINCIIALGANLDSTKGSAQDAVSAAMARIAGKSEGDVAKSRLYRTPAFPPGSGPDFTNAAIGIRTSRSASGVLALLHAIEQDFGRARNKRWEARVLDLDLIAMGQTILPNPETLRHWITLAPEKQAQEAPQELLLPHPRLQDRGFVLVPLRDVAPDWRHPLLGKTVRQMAAELDAATLADIRAVE